VLVPLQEYTWHDYAGPTTQICVLLYSLFISYRVVRKSTLPSVPGLGLLLGLVWLNSWVN
jgi:hypothetical protein